MSCCGQRRQQWQQSNGQQSNVTPVRPILENPVPVRHHGSEDCLMKGPATGYLYLFSANEQGLMVDGRDAALLVAGSEKFSLTNQ